MQKVLTITALLGLAVSLWAMPKQQAAPDGSNRALTKSEMTETQGSGNNKVCSARTCNDDDGCGLFKDFYYTHYPKTVCTVYWYDSTCYDFASDICYDQQWYENFGCPSGKKAGLPRPTNTDYCSLY